MKYARLILMTSTLGLLVGLLVWLGRMPADPKLSPVRPKSAIGAATIPAGQALRIGIIPERDIFEQRKRYLALADELAVELDRPVELVTCSSYQGVLQDLAEKHVDAAFLGSLVAVMAVDRLGCRILVKPQGVDGHTTYRGTIFVRDDSPIRRIEELSGRSLAMVRTTLGGHLYPMVRLFQAGLTDSPQSPRLVWCGTHDEAIEQVISGKADAGAAKDIRLEAIERQHPGVKLRRLCTGSAVPENALAVDASMSRQLQDQLGKALLTMHDSPAGRAALERFGAARFQPCRIEEYDAVFDLVDAVRDRWQRLNLDAPAPNRR